jgi:hypothetical protein
LRSQKKKARTKSVRASINRTTYYLPQPEQEAQHSAEGQHVTLAAFTVPARLSATTAIITTTRKFFMDFSPLKNQFAFLSTDSAAVGADSKKTSGDVSRYAASAS